MRAFERTQVRSNADNCYGRLQAACERGVLRATVMLQGCVRVPWCYKAACDRGAAACVGAFEHTKCGRTHYGSIFTLSPLSCPLLAMFVAMTCTTLNTKNYTKC
jgi:hypothetical protein